MEILIAYDVATDSRAGRRRLRKVAQICEAHGQRVQKSVFECILSPADMEMLVYRLRVTIDEDEDSLRIYRLREPRDRYLQIYGQKPSHDLDEPLMV